MAGGVAGFAWKLVGTGSGVIAASQARKLVAGVWRKARKVEPPVNPGAPSVSWGEALTWAVASGVGVGVGRMVAARLAAGAWQKATGKLPPGLEEMDRPVHDQHAS